MIDKTIKYVRSQICSESGFTLLEIMATLVITCLFIVVFTQMMGISFKDIFAKRDKTEAISTAQNVVEKIKAIRNNPPALNDLESSLLVLGESLAENGKNANVQTESALINPEYDPDCPVRFLCVNRTKTITNADGSQETLTLMDVSVVVFYNNGDYHVRFDDTI